MVYQEEFQEEFQVEYQVEYQVECQVQDLLQAIPPVSAAVELAVSQLDLLQAVLPMEHPEQHLTDRKSVV